jgi:hypothetical protein
MRHLRFNHYLLLWLFLFSFEAQALTSFADYQARVEQAAKLADSLSDRPTNEQLNRLQKLKQLLPAQEEVEWQGQVIHVDNTWLHEALNAGSTQMLANPQAIAVLQARLDALQQRLAATTGQTLDEAQRARLARILAQAEYQQDQKQESGIKQWLGKIWRKLWAWLMRLFGGRTSAQARPGQFTLNLVRLVILIALLFLFLFAFFKLFGRLRRRARPAAEPGTREILGEQIEEETTTEDLLAQARALAKQGDYRAAIRRAYIALLYELEQRGKLRLHRSKTNRDYLEDLRGEQTLYPSFVALTRIFERIWYGHTSATEFDFEGFLTGYREAVRSDL